MDIFIIIILIVITLLLVTISGNLKWIKVVVDNIEEMVVMSNKEKYKYNLKKDDPKGYQEYIEGEYWREQEAKKKE